jgi:glycine cleavage system H protein
MSGLKFTEQHEWVRLDGDVATIGISDYASEQLGDVVYVELPEKGRQLDQSGELAVVESVKAASEVYAPIAGEVVDVNDALEEDPAIVNASPTGDGWIVKIKVKDGDEMGDLMDQEAYDTYLEGLD